MRTLNINGERQASRSGLLCLGRRGRLKGRAELHGLEVLGQVAGARGFLFRGQGRGIHHADTHQRWV